MKFDIEKYDFTYEENDPFFGECWLSNKKFKRKAFLSNSNFDDHLFVYIPAYNSLYNMGKYTVIRILEVSESEIKKFINEQY